MQGRILKYLYDEGDKWVNVKDLLEYTKLDRINLTARLAILHDNNFIYKMCEGKCNNTKKIYVKISKEGRNKVAWKLAKLTSQT